MSRWIALSLGLVMAGCAEPKSSDMARTPKTVTQIVPSESEIPKAETGLAAEDVNASTGKWTHTIPDPDGKNLTIVLEYIKDQDGRERFEFVEQPWPEKPVFDQRTVDGEQTELRFSLVDPESPDSSKTVRYVLKQEPNQWVGKLYESWTVTPYDVVLTKLN